MFSFIRLVLIPVSSRWLLFWFYWKLVYLPLATIPSTTVLVQLSHHYCKCLSFDPAVSLKPLQSIFKPSSQISPFKNLSCHVSPLLQTLQWPLISFRINAKALIMAYRLYWSFFEKDFLHHFLLLFLSFIPSSAELVSFLLLKQKARNILHHIFYNS